MQGSGLFLDQLSFEFYSLPVKFILGILAVGFSLLDLFYFVVFVSLQGCSAFLLAFLNLTAFYSFYCQLPFLPFAYFYLS